MRLGTVLGGRRAMARDKATHLLRSEREMVEKGKRDLRHRAEGAMARARKAIEPEKVPDRVLEERVRARLGRHVTHPSSIDVSAQDGRVVLSGPVFSSEVDGLVRATRRVPGVRELESRLEAHDTADRVPGLQGEPHRLPRSLLRREVWPPALRLVASGAGLGLGAYGLARRGAFGAASATPGGALLLRATVNRPASKLFGATEQSAVTLQKTITVDAPVSEVFALWSDVESFPRFMDHVREVHASRDGRRSRWTLQGPGGTRLSWDAEVTRYEKNRAFAWRTLPGSAVEHAGTVELEPRSQGRTRIHVRMWYRPPAGALGHAVASLLGADAKRALDDDLVRMKSLLEEHKATAHGEEVTHEELRH